jgi:hypothetical protein
VSLDRVLHDAHSSGAGLRITSDGKPGDIIAEGFILNRKTRFAKRIPFLDMAVHFHDNVLRTDFLYLGRQPLEYGFPNNTSFNSVAVINLTDSTMKVTPVIVSGKGMATQRITLPDIMIQNPNTALLDLNAAQEKGLIPISFHSGGLELHFSGNGSIIADLFTQDEQGDMK